MSTLSAAPYRWQEHASESDRAAAKNALLHLWGYPLSDRELETLETRWGLNKHRLGELLEVLRGPRS